MNYPIEIRKIDQKLEFYEEVIPLLKRSEDYLRSHSWCKRIDKGWLFNNTGFALCIFLFDVDTGNKDDGLTWVIVGDFPSMYTDTYSVPTTKDALEYYIELASDWIENVENGLSIEENYPFKVSIQEEMVKLFKKKVNSLKTIILPAIDELSYEIVLE